MVARRPCRCCPPAALIQALPDLGTLHTPLRCSLERKKSPNRLVVDDAVNQVRH